jgi:hypothetical protein
MASHAEGDMVTQLADLSQTVDQVQTELSLVVRQMNESLHGFRDALSRMIESESRIEGQIGAARQLERKLTHVQELLQSSSLYPAPPPQTEPGIELNRVNESLRRLSEAGTQEEILHAFLNQTLGYVKRAILFVNKEMQFVPWNHVGFSNENIPSITAEDPNDPIVRAASQRKILYREQTPALGLSWSQESGSLPHAFVCIPMVFNQNVPLVFYGDSDQTISLDSLELLSHMAALVLKNQFLTSLVQKEEGVAAPSEQTMSVPAAAAPAQAEERPLWTPVEPEPVASAVPAAEAEAALQAAAEVTEEAAEPAPAWGAEPEEESRQPMPELTTAEPVSAYVEAWEAEPPAPGPEEQSDQVLAAEPEAAAVQPEAVSTEPPAIAGEPQEAADVDQPAAQQTEPLPEEPIVSSGQTFELTPEPVQTAFTAASEIIEEPSFVEPQSEEPLPTAPSAQEATTEDTKTPPPPLEMPVYEPAPAVEPELPSEEEEKYHNEARRFARLLVSEIKLYNEEEVSNGRHNKDIYNRLKRDIDRSREMYEKRVNPAVAGKMDYLHEELVRILAKEDQELLGIDYPGPVNRTRSA